MSVEVAHARDSAPAVSPTKDVGLWRESWFRVLTITNVSLLVGSALTGLGLILGAPAESLSWLLFAMPVVPVTVFAPVVSLVIVLAAAALSTLNMIGETQKGVRFVRAMTVWGTIVLSTPLLFAALVGVIGAVSALVAVIGDLW
ncbi:hypothetical protein [Microbacterium sp. SSM24]|uniref:hypothetical protein n=1 Tax=Microbacterium sp. SSM24 TaxID=2991714 RepID=UPI002226146C|nr:hypothetical protein [Microbacterium sp. SSM24]MCW3493680.1 hypothetical protein [Microbacterium sp. SSM24]